MGDYIVYVFAVVAILCGVVADVVGARHGWRWTVPISALFLLGTWLVYLSLDENAGLVVQVMWGAYATSGIFTELITFMVKRGRRVTT
jgi:hypothetical protein